MLRSVKFANVSQVHHSLSTHHSSYSYTIRNSYQLSPSSAKFVVGSFSNWLHGLSFISNSMVR